MEITGYTETHLTTADGKKHKISYNDVGYPFIRLNGRTKQVARLIASSFVLTVSDNDRVEFIDGNPRNFRQENLRVVSRSYLSRKAYASRRFKGRCISKSKIREVKQLCKKSTVQEVSRVFGCSARTIRRYRDV